MPSTSPAHPATPPAETSNVVDVGFRLVSAMRGATLPLDHGYALFSAISRILPEAHGARWLGVHPLEGKRDGDRLVLPGSGCLWLRVPAEKIPMVLRLAAQRLRVLDASWQLGPPIVERLAPVASVDARTVYIKLTGIQAPDDTLLRDRYAAELKRQLAAIGAQGEASLQGKRRIMVAGKSLVGFSVRVTGLDDSGSVLLQSLGLGGKRAMGCGIFRPTRTSHA